MTRMRKVTSEGHRERDVRSVEVSLAAKFVFCFSVIESEEFEEEEDDDEEDVVAEEDDDDDDSEEDEVSQAACLCQARRGRLLSKQMHLKLNGNFSSLVKVMCD